MSETENRYNERYKIKTRKDIGKAVFRSTLVSISIACAIFVVIGVINDLAGGGSMTLYTGYAFSRMALATLITALGFGIPSFVYNIESIPKGLATLIHMGIGISIYITVGAMVGWIPVNKGIWVVVGSVGISIGASFLIWLGFFFKYRKEDRKINDAIKNKNS